MQLTGVMFNPWHKLHHLCPAWYLFWPQDWWLFFLFFSFQVLFNNRGLWVNGSGASHHDCPYESTQTVLKQIVLLVLVILALLVKMNSVLHRWNTYIPHTLRTQKAQLYFGRSLWHPYYFQCPCSDCRVWVYIVSNHRDTSLTFGDDVCDHGIWAVPVEITFPLGEERKRSRFLSGSRLSLPCGELDSSLPDFILNDLWFWNVFQHHLFCVKSMYQPFPKVAILINVCKKLKPISNSFFNQKKIKKCFGCLLHCVWLTMTSECSKLGLNPLLLLFSFCFSSTTFPPSE